jgi:hypothetical protein
MARSKSQSPENMMINEPGVDWLPLELAPLHYVIDYTASAQEWADQLRKLTELAAEFMTKPRTHPRGRNFHSTHLADPSSLGFMLSKGNSH